MDYFILRPSDGDLREMLTLRIHRSFIAGLEKASGVAFGNGEGKTLNRDDAARLDDWANSYENPTGQRADLARSIAGIVRAGGGATVGALPSNAPRGFWESV